MSASPVPAPQILNTFQQRTQIVGNGFSLFASTSGQLPLNYQWFLNGNPLLNQTNATISIPHVRLEDAGDYGLFISNAQGFASNRVAQLNVVPLTLTLYTYGSPSPAPEFSYLQFYSAVDSSSSVSYQWRKNGIPLVGAYNNYVQFAALRLSDSGAYDVVARNDSGSVTSQVVNVSVVLAGPTGPTGEVPTVFAAVNTEARLFSNVTGSAPLYFQWFRAGVPITDLSTNGLLIISSVKFEDSGDYSVRASNSVAMITNLVAHLVVQPLTVSQPFKLSGEPDFLQEAETLQVNVSSTVPFELQWYFMDLPVAGATNETLHFDELAATNNGPYFVIGRNSFGSATSAVTRVQVLESAPSVNLPTAAATIEGNVFQFRAYVGGGPKPALQWRFGGTNLTDQTNDTLFLPRANQAQSGLYELVASNHLGAITQAVSLAVRSEQALDRWTWRRPAPQGAHLKDVAFGDGRYVAVGDEGNIIVSTNGVDWESIMLKLDGDIRQLAYGNGRYVALATARSGSFAGFGGPLVLTSTNAKDWTAHPTPKLGDFASVTFGAGVFVATVPPYATSRALVFSSTDGIEWTPQIVDGIPARATTWTGEKFVAVTQDSAYFSLDGKIWNRAGSVNVLLRTLDYYNGRFVGITYSGIPTGSADGLFWEEAPTVTRDFQSFAGAGGLFIAATSEPNGIIYTSNDGLSWQAWDTGIRREINSIIFAEGKFLAVGDAGTISSSIDGYVWNLGIGNGADNYGVAQSPMTIAIAADAGVVLTSSNGSNWVQRTTPTTKNLHTIHYADGLFVAGGRKGTIITSPDAIAWTERPTGSINYIERLAWGNRTWVGAGEQGDIFTSSDGISWSVKNTGEPLTDHEGVAFGNGLWVMVGGYFANGTFSARGTVALSTNATDWSVSPAAFGVRLRDVAFGNGQFVAIGNDGLVAVFSGKEFYTNVFSIHYDNLRRVYYANGLFVAVGNAGAVYSSPTPHMYSSWIHHRVPTQQNFHDALLMRNGRWVIVGNNGMVLDSARMTPRLTVRNNNSIATITSEAGLELDGLKLEMSHDLIGWDVIPSAEQMTIQTTGPNTFFRFRGE